MRSSHGFTIVELLIVIGVFALFAGIATIVGTRSLRNTEFDRVRETIRMELSSAQADTIGGTLDSAWGVAVFPNAVTRFRGSTYATRVSAFDRTTTFGNAVIIGGASEVDFTRPFGLPASATSITYTDGVYSATTTVSTAGAIDVQ